MYVCVQSSTIGTCKRKMKSKTDFSIGDAFCQLTLFI